MNKGDTALFGENGVGDLLDDGLGSDLRRTDFPNLPVYNSKFGYARHLTMLIGFRVITISPF